MYNFVPKKVNPQFANETVKLDELVVEHPLDTHTDRKRQCVQLKIPDTG